MKRIVLITAALLAMECSAQVAPKHPCVLHDKNGNPQLCLPQTPKIKFEIPLALIDKAKAESQLIDALLQNLTEMEAGILNPETDQKIRELSLKIERQP